MTAANYTLDHVAEPVGASSWTLYQAIKDSTPPVPVIRCGKLRVLFARVVADRLLCLTPDQEACHD